MADIRERYLDINSHASSYNWMALRKHSHEQVFVQLRCGSLRAHLEHA